MDTVSEFLKRLRKQSYSEQLAQKIQEGADAYKCPRCGWQGDPFIWLVQNAAYPKGQVAFTCVPCNRHLEAKDPSFQ